MSEEKRPENLAYENFIEARKERQEEWPEPETTALWKILRRAALYIIYGAYQRREVDLAREAATKALLALPDFRGETTFSSWYYRIVLNTVKDRFRRENYRRRVEVPLEVVGDLPVEAQTGEAKTLESAPLSEREQRLLDFMQDRNYNPDSPDAEKLLAEFAKQESLHPRSAWKVWKRIERKLKSHLSS